VDVSLNLVLFIPLGAGLGLLGVRPVRALMVLALTTLTVEVLQLSLVVGRDASLSDLITNTIGGTAGYWASRRWRDILHPSQKTSLIVACLGAAAWLLIQGFTGFAFQRDLPPTVYYGQWAAELGQCERFTGEVVSVRLPATPLPGTRLASSPEVRSALLNPRSVLEVRARSGQPTTGLAPIFSIFDDRQREIVLLGQDGRDLIYRVRTRTGGLGLRGPALRLREALPRDADFPFQLRASYRPGQYDLETIGGTDSSTGTLVLSASWGWAMFLPFDHAFGEEMPWLTMLWVGGLLFAVSYYAGHSGQLGRPTAVIMLLILLAIGLGLIPALAGFSVFQPLEWVAGMLGPALGFSLGTRGRVTQGPTFSTE
jgi:hypothetical protein